MHDSGRVAAAGEGVGTGGGRFISYHLEKRSTTELAMYGRMSNRLPKLN